MNLKRLELIIKPENISSEKVAIKCKYIKEGTLKKIIQDKYNKELLVDGMLYPKVM